MATPTTLWELAGAAQISVGELPKMTDAQLQGIFARHAVAGADKEKMTAQYHKLRLSQAATKSHHRFDAFLSRVGQNSALVGFENVPVSDLRTAVSFIKGKGAPSRDALDAAVAMAYAKADALLAEGPDPHNLSRDEIAVINIYTQDFWGPPGAPVKNLDANTIRISSSVLGAAVVPASK